MLASDPRAGLRLLQHARESGLGSLNVLAGRDPSALVREFPVVPLESLLEARVPSVTAEGFGYDPSRGELWFAGETAEAVLLELQARRRALSAEADELETNAAAAAARAAEAEGRARAAEAAFDGVSARLRRPPVDAHTLDRLVLSAERLANVVSAAQTIAGRFEPALRARVDAGAERAGALGEELRRFGAAEVELRRELEEASAASTQAEVELARLEAETEENRRRLEALGDVEPAAGDDRDELATRAERLEARRVALGMVNPLAQQEYEAEKERLDDLRTQREDLERSLEELERLREELAETVERRFAETFAAVTEHFHEVAGTLFPGGEGRLRLVEPDAEGGGDGTEGEAGVEVELRPAGKRITRLSLLSGGEKALGAIAFLFALFLARPCAFYLLDEVEAALDDSNIARFIELLRRCSDRAQFVVVTHQKRTMKAADVLYGVTMGNEGVSQVVSRRFLASSTPPPRRIGWTRCGPRVDADVHRGLTWPELLGDEPTAEDETEARVCLAHAVVACQEPPRADRADRVGGVRPVRRRGVGAARGALLRGDVGVPATAELVRRLEARGGIDNVERALQEEVETLFGGPPTLDLSARPTVLLVVGVNGTGKTTTIGKLAQKLREHGRSVLVGAADTFRAAAEEQLEIWAERAGADFVGAPRGGDPAAVAFDAVEAGRARGRDVVIIDTAGRLHTQGNLMAELEKVRR